MNITQHSLRISELIERLRIINLVDADEIPIVAPLEGGVSSDIWRVNTRQGTICIKRALHRLKTEKEWYAPVERNVSEANWLRYVHSILPNAVPKLLIQDVADGLFAMEYLNPDIYPVWKSMLRDGDISPKIGRKIGSTLGKIHSFSAGKNSVQELFATDDIFFAIRIEPYLLRTAQTHRDLTSNLKELAEITASTQKVLVHGDISPKNILVGPNGPVFLDAECAWYGDPAFDIGFCLNHLLLKCIWRPQWTNAYIDVFSNFVAGYFYHVDWEQPQELQKRAAHLLPALMLARIDGASPVEYIECEGDRVRVRNAARHALLEPCNTLDEVCVQFKLDCVL